MPIPKTRLPRAAPLRSSAACCSRASRRAASRPSMDATVGMAAADTYTEDMVRKAGRVDKAGIAEAGTDAAAGAVVETAMGFPSSP